MHLRITCAGWALFVIITAIGMGAICVHFMLCTVIHAHVHIHSAKRSLHGLHCNQDKNGQNHVFHCSIIHLTRIYVYCRASLWNDRLSRNTRARTQKDHK